MSFFQEEGDDSNLQYDDNAFIFFLASTFIIAALVFLILIYKHLKQLNIPNKNKILSVPYLQSKFQNLQKYKRKQIFNKWLFLKIAIFIILVFCIFVIHNKSLEFKGKLKGFNPYQILGLKQGATLRQVKKAYRQLAKQYHPDKNKGDPQSRSKFILISKSYQCFTNEDKRQSCFKYGNPDGTQTSRVGIGLPAIFIKLQYKWIVLPIILLTFLVIIPYFALRWSSKQFIKDNNGISIHSLSKLFKCLDINCNKFTVLCLLSSYKQLYQQLGYGPISQENKNRLFQQLDRYPDSKKQFIQDFTDDQLYIFWEIYQYMAGIGEFSHPQFQQIVQKYLQLSLNAVIVFCYKQNDGVSLYGNPDWKIVFLGTQPIEAYCSFSRDYYNRTLAPDQRYSIWLNNLDLTAQQKIIGERAGLNNLYGTLKIKGYQGFVKLFGAQRQNIIRSQIQNLPIYYIQMKLKVDNRQVKQLTIYDYCEIYFKISRLNQTNGYSVIANYPYPKKQRLLLIALQDQNIIYHEFVQFQDQKDYYINKLPYRAQQNQSTTISFMVLSQVYHHIDINNFIQYTFKNIKQQWQEKRIKFHPDDLNLQRLGKQSYFQSMLDLKLDSDDHQLSDTEQQEQKQEQN